MSLSGDNRSLHSAQPWPDDEQTAELFVCGAQKSGTTALAAYLRQHPGIQRPKKLHFFDDEMQPRPEPDPGSLHSHFQGADADQLWGEATPISLYWDPAAERIWRTTQQCV